MLNVSNLKIRVIKLDKSGSIGSTISAFLNEAMHRRLGSPIYLSHPRDFRMTMGRKNLIDKLIIISSL